MCQNFVTVIVLETCAYGKYELYVLISRDFNELFVVILCVLWITPTIVLSHQ